MGNNRMRNGQRVGGELLDEVAMAVSQYSSAHASPSRPADYVFHTERAATLSSAVSVLICFRLCLSVFLAAFFTARLSL
jgi:hypothetical protein